MAANLATLIINVEQKHEILFNEETTIRRNNVKGPHKDMKHFFHETAMKLYTHIDF